MQCHIGLYMAAIVKPQIYIKLAKKSILIVKMMILGRNIMSILVVDSNFL